MPPPSGSQGPATRPCRERRCRRRLASRRRIVSAASADGTTTVTGASGSPDLASPMRDRSASTAGAPNGTTRAVARAVDCVPWPLPPSLGPYRGGVTLNRCVWPRSSWRSRSRSRRSPAAHAVGGGGSTKAFCEAVHGGDNPLDVFDRYDPTNVATAREQLQRGVDRMQELNGLRHRRSAATSGRWWTSVRSWSMALDPAAGAKATPDFSGDFQRVKDASSAVTQFAADRCGVDLQAPTAPDPQAPANVN